MKYMDKIEHLFDLEIINYIIFDTETASPTFEPHDGKLIMFSITDSHQRKGVAIPLVVNNEVSKKWDKEIPPLDFQITEQQSNILKNRLACLLKKIPIVGHNLKFDSKWVCYHLNINPAELKIKADTYIYAFQLFGKDGIRGALDLKTLSSSLCGVEKWNDELKLYLKCFRKKEDKHYGNIPTQMLGSYAALDAENNLLLYEYLDSKLGDKMKDVASQITSAIIPFTELELKGLHIEKDLIGKTSDHLYKETNILLDEIYENLFVKAALECKKIEGGIEDIEDEEDSDESLEDAEEKSIENKLNLSGDRSIFNINSSKDLIILFFDPRFFNLPILSKKNKFVSKKTGTPSTGRHVIDYFIESDQTPQVVKDFLEKLCLYKDNKKLIANYIVGLNKTLQPDNTYKPNFNLSGTRTGRLSSGLHTIPKKSSLKRLFDSRWRPDGGLILYADFSQLELRVLASVANDVKMIDSFRKGIDAHTSTAAGAFNVPISEVTKAQRNAAKAINFGIVYGRTAKSIATTLNMTEQEAQDLYNNFYNNFSDVKDWMIRHQHNVRQQKKVTTLFGREIPIPEAHKARISQYDLAVIDRKAVNYIIQSSASDAVMYSYLKTYNTMKKLNMKTLFTGTVHDSIMYDVFPGELFDIACLVKKNSEILTTRDLPWLKCPMVVDVNIGTSWGCDFDGKLKEFTRDHILLSGHALKQDFLDVVECASKSYNVELDIKEKVDLSNKKWDHTSFIRDTEEWHGEILISKKK
jgi:DNA polymerase-1